VVEKKTLTCLEDDDAFGFLSGNRQDAGTDEVASLCAKDGVLAFPGMNAGDNGDIV
jgi:hypothetical protein